MTIWIKAAILMVVAAGLSGCVEEPELSDNITPPKGMRAHCITQAANKTGLPRSAIAVTSRIETGGGPLLTLDAGGQSLSCRREANGRVTVFSEYAN